MKDQVLDLAKKAASYKRGGDYLLKAIAEVEQLLIYIFDEYTQFRYVNGNIAYLANLASSNVGIYGPALCYVDDREGYTQFKPMPTSWATSGGGFYLHDDFHVRIGYATRAEVVKVAIGLPDFLLSLADFLEEKGNLNSKSAEEIEKIANNLRNAV